MKPKIKKPIPLYRAVMTWYPLEIVEDGCVKTIEVLSRAKQEPTDLEEIVMQFVEVVESAIKSGDWKVDGACDPDALLKRAKRFVKETQQKETT